MKVLSNRKRKSSRVAAVSTRAVRARKVQRSGAALRRTPLRKIVQTLRKHLPDFKIRYPIKSLGIFGSYARKDATDKSDLDVLIEFEDKSPSLLKIVHLENELTDLLGIKVDLVEKKVMKPRILENVMREIVPI